MKKAFWLLAVATALFSCTQQKDYSAYTGDPLLYCKTVKKLNDVVLYNNFSPVVASRNYAYANIAAYECMAAGNAAFPTLSGRIRHLPPMPRPDSTQTVDYHLAALLAFVKVGNAVTFPEGVLMDYYQEVAEGARAAGMSRSLLTQTMAYSDTVAATILKWSKGDNYARSRSAEKFTVSQEDGRWIPTPPAYAQALEPQWCTIRPLLLDSAAQFMPPAPPKYNMKDTASPYYREVMEVKNIVEGLTPEQKHIADFFDDNPFNLHVTGHVMYATKKFSPPGHWMNIVGIAAQKAGADFDKTVAAYTETAIALFDGFIACWKSKYSTNTIRPETVINKFLDPTWQPYIQTPPFPSYVSGHSVISSASAEVMTHHFGDNFAYTDTSELEFGIPNRSFQSFREAAQEAGWSRLYGGIHFRSDLEQGNEVGKKIGDYVLQRLHGPDASTQLSYQR
jgi:hypothetical protein